MESAFFDIINLIRYNKKYYYIIYVLEHVIHNRDSRYLRGLSNVC